MVQCPNCKQEIGRFELSPNCKNCGANLFYLQQEKELLTDVKRTELEFATFRILVAKLKFGFIGGRLQIARLAMSIIEVLGLLLPFAVFRLDSPIYSGRLSFGAIGFYQAFTSGGLMALFDYAKLSVSKTAALLSFVLIAAILLVLLADLLILAGEVLSFIDLKKTAGFMKGSAVFGIVAALCCLAASIAVANYHLQLTDTVSLSAGFGPGSVVTLLMFVIMLIINIKITKSDIEPDIKAVDLQRVEMNKKVKSGEVSLECLPCPVFESEEERERRLEAEAELNMTEAELKALRERRAAERKAAKKEKRRRKR